MVWTIKRIQQHAGKYFDEEEFKKLHPELYRIAQNHNWLKRLKYNIYPDHIVIGQGWRIPYPPQNYIFNLAHDLQYTAEQEAD